MKKNLKKLFVLILIVVTSLTAIMTTYAETILDSFEAEHTTIKPAIDFPADFHVIKTTDGKHVFCLQYNKKGPVKGIKYDNTTLITDNGMNYILNKAYSAKTDEDHFIYKSALWLYMIDKGLMEGSYKNLKTFYSNVKNSNTSEAKEILELIADAKKASANDTSAPTIKVDTDSVSFELDSTGKYYVSNPINVTSSTGSYNVKLTNAPSESTVEKNGNTFVIKVLVDKVINLETSVEFKVNNTKDVYTSYRYEPSNSNYQPLAATYKETKTASSTGKLTLNKTVSVPFLKVDAETGEAISGAELKLVDSNGNIIKTWTSTENSEVITGLVAGVYTLVETKAPEGYKEIEGSITFSIDSKGNILDVDGKVISIVKITNERKTGGVSISKQDITNKEELPGAKLVVKDYDGNVIEEWISTNKPHYIEKLTPGIYTLTEIIAPEGYILSDETITFTVKDDGTITKVVMYNTPASKEEVPVEPTSSFKTITSSIIGTVIILIGSYLIFKNSKKKEVM